MTKKNPTGDLLHLLGVKAFTRLNRPFMFSELYPPLFAHTGIYEEDKDYSTEYYWALIEHGIPKGAQTVKARCARHDWQWVFVEKVL